MSPDDLHETTAAGRKHLEAVVARRATLETRDDIRSALSFARAEQLFGREYHGRFLIELMQNAADAWRMCALPGERSALKIVVEGDPLALVVANRGAPFPVTVVLDSLGQIGQSTKEVGEAIGHKGIGFKSVLEISPRPELYSGFDADRDPHLAVQFDRRSALKMIRAGTALWDDVLAEPAAKVADQLAAVPGLRYPTWVEHLPPIVRELANEGYDTVVRAPFDALTDRSDWLRIVRDSLEDVSDRILVLLGTFDSVEIEDRATRSTRRIVPRWAPAHAERNNAPTVEAVAVERDGVPSSAWAMSHRTGAHDEGLSAEYAVGIRLLATPNGRFDVISAMAPPDGAGHSVTTTEPATAPFHLFFPTRIGSGLPFLLHGYFEVDAARTGFYAGSAETNAARLNALADVTVEAAADLVARDDVSLVSLVNLISSCAVPEDARAAAFRDRVLAGLDDVAWIPLAPAAGQSDVRACPRDVVPCAPTLITRRVGDVFSPAYVRERTGLGIPHPDLTQNSMDLLLSRQGHKPDKLWSVLRALLTPGDLRPWSSGAEAPGFKRLINLITIASAADKGRTEALLEALRGDPASRLLPVPTGGGLVELLPVPDPTPGSRTRTTLVMARIRDLSSTILEPPASLDVGFLPAGLLSEDEVVGARSLGVRPFTVDSVLDRLNVLSVSAAPAVDVDDVPQVMPGEPTGRADSSATRNDSSATDDDPAEMLRFLWALLTRERRSEFGTSSGTSRAEGLNPAHWFWLKPGRGELEGNERDRQRREELLTRVLLPARDGSWRPAGSLTLGADWADWLALNFGEVRMGSRMSVLRDLDLVTPGDMWMLASPELVLEHMPSLVASSLPAVDDVQASSADESVARDTTHPALEQLAFLLRLGVWEVPPVEGYESRVLTGTGESPWAGERAQLAPGIDHHWSFRAPAWWGGPFHRNARVAEDFHLAWPLEQPDEEHRLAMTRALAAGAALYVLLAQSSAFCPGCTSSNSTHRAWYTTAPSERHESTLALQLRCLPWLPVTRNGASCDAGTAPADAWWEERPPRGSAIATSPLQFLDLCHPDADLPPSLRALARIEDLSHASEERLTTLLRALRASLETGEHAFDLDRATSRQAYRGLHSRIYGGLAVHGDVIASRVVADTGVLCDLNGALQHVPIPEARHDDGRFVAHQRRFAGQIPFVVLPRDRSAIASALGVAPFDVVVTRRAGDPGADVTEELQDALADRVPELLAILVHASLGAQTMDPASQAFDVRVGRLRQLRVIRVADLVLDVHVVGTDHRVTTGDGTANEMYLHDATGKPRVYHDLVGSDWIMRCRRMIASPLAEIVESTAYASTFKLLLQAETESEREDILLELGVTSADVDDMRRRSGALSEIQILRTRHWFTAVLSSLAQTRDPEAGAVGDPDAEHLAEALASAGLPVDVARMVSAAGYSSAVLSDTDRGSVLWHLSRHGAALDLLDGQLRRFGDPSLMIRVAQQQLRDWSAAHGQQVAAVLVKLGTEEQVAKAAPAAWVVPSHLRLSLEPSLASVLAPVVSGLEAAGAQVDPDALASDAATELARIAGWASDVLRRETAVLFSAEERAQQVLALARSWRSSLVLVGVLARSIRGESKAAIRGHKESLESSLPAGLREPRDYKERLLDLLGDSALIADLDVVMDDRALTSAPNEALLLEVAGKHGVPVDLAGHVQSTMRAPVRELVRDLQDRTEQLTSAKVAIGIPAVLAAKTMRLPPARAARGGSPKGIAAVKVDASVDRRKRELGADAEGWALAALVADVVKMPASERIVAVDRMCCLLTTHFSGPPVDQAIAHSAMARTLAPDEEDLIESLSGLMHVATYADGFGFDLLGWLAPSSGAMPRACAVEVKGASSGTFHMSTNEWATADRLGRLDVSYAVLVVRRGAKRSLPTRMDLLPDPIALVETAQLSRASDGYLMDYLVS